MAKIIYACEVVFLSDSDKRANTKILRRGQLPKVERFLQFVMYVYLPWWRTAPAASGAPANDLDLINKLLRYHEVDVKKGNGQTEEPPVVSRRGDGSTESLQPHCIGRHEK